jgi:hypothetical protein
LLDGMPLNTPSGGWVYWQRVPQASIESVEIYNGSPSILTVLNDKATLRNNEVPGVI